MAQFSGVLETICTEYDYGFIYTKSSASRHAVLVRRSNIPSEITEEDVCSGNRITVDFDIMRGPLGPEAVNVRVVESRPDLELPILSKSATVEGVVKEFDCQTDRGVLLLDEVNLAKFVFPTSMKSGQNCGPLARVGDRLCVTIDRKVDEMGHGIVVSCKRILPQSPDCLMRGVIGRIWSSGDDRTYESGILCTETANIPFVIDDEFSKLLLSRGKTDLMMPDKDVALDLCFATDKHIGVAVVVGVHALTSIPKLKKEDSFRKVVELFKTKLGGVIVWVSEERQHIFYVERAAETDYKLFAAGLEASYDMLQTIQKNNMLCTFSMPNTACFGDMCCPVVVDIRRKVGAIINDFHPVKMRGTLTNTKGEKFTFCIAPNSQWLQPDIVGKPSDYDMIWNSQSPGIPFIEPIIQATPTAYANTLLPPPVNTTVSAIPVISYQSNGIPVNRVRRENGMVYVNGIVTYFQPTARTGLLRSDDGREQNFYVPPDVLSYLTRRLGLLFKEGVKLSLAFLESENVTCKTVRDALILPCRA